MQVDLVGINQLVGQVPDSFLDPAFDRIAGERERRDDICPRFFSDTTRMFSERRVNDFKTLEGIGLSLHTGSPEKDLPSLGKTAYPTIAIL